MVRIDGFALIFKAIFLVSAALAIAISTRYLDIEGEQHGEYYALVLFATVGMMFLACGFDLIALYISLELMALTFYVLVAFTKREKRSNEAAMKYFLLGAFSSGVLLYGMSLLFGIAGSTNLAEIGQAVANIAASSGAPGEPVTASLRPMLLLGMIALAAGLFFKIAAVLVPHVGARRLRGRADIGNGLPLYGFESSEFCSLRAHFCRSPSGYTR